MNKRTEPHGRDRGRDGEVDGDLDYPKSHRTSKKCLDAWGIGVHINIDYSYSLHPLLVCQHPANEERYRARLR